LRPSSVSQPHSQTHGIQEAVERYGQPLELELDLSLDDRTWRYWRLASRKRCAEVVIVVQGDDGRVLLHTKTFYPPGVYRLLSGGVKPGESIIAAVEREACEETGLQVQIQRFLGIVRYRFHHHGETLPFTSYVFLVHATGQPQLQGGEESISDFCEVSPEELDEIARQLESLPSEWRDWGRFRAVAHRFVARILGNGKAS